MGVGKTIQAISIAYLFPREWPVLIITPASLKFSWRDELLQWIEYLRPDQIQVFQKSTEDFDPNACIYIMSYVIATKLSLPIQNKKFQIVICDEAHYLKSRDVSNFAIFNPIEFKKQGIGPNSHESEEMSASVRYSHLGSPQRTIQLTEDLETRHLLLLQRIRDALLQPKRELFRYRLDRLCQHERASLDAGEICKYAS
jgi:hypothetical protein